MRDDKLKRTAMDIPTASIRPPRRPYRPQKKYDVAYAYMSDSFDSSGQLNGVLVSYEGMDKDGNPIYECIDGWHRVCHNKERGVEFTQATVLYNVSERDRDRFMFEANHIRIPCEHIEAARKIQQILAHEDKTQAELGKELGISQFQISMLLKLNNLDEDVLTLVKTGEIQLTNAKRLGCLPKFLQEEFVERAKTLPMDEFKRVTQPFVCGYKIKKHNERQLEELLKPFEPKGQLKRLRRLKTEIDTQKEAAKIPADTSAKDAFSLGVRWACGLDAEAVAKQKAVFEKRLQQALENAQE